MIIKEVVSDTDSVYNYMDNEIVAGYLEIRLVDGVIDIMNLFVIHSIGIVINLIEK